jgi:hypothetical protein
MWKVYIKVDLKEIRCEGVDWSHLPDRFHYQGLVNAVMDFYDSIKCREFLDQHLKDPVPQFAVTTVCLVVAPVPESLHCLKTVGSTNSTLIFTNVYTEPTTAM